MSVRVVNVHRLLGPDMLPESCREWLVVLEQSQRVEMRVPYQFLEVPQTQYLARIYLEPALATLVVPDAVRVVDAVQLAVAAIARKVARVQGEAVMEKKITAKQVAKDLVNDAEYRAHLRQRLVDGTLPEALEVLLWDLAFGPIAKRRQPKA